MTSSSSSLVVEVKPISQLKLDSYCLVVPDIEVNDVNEVSLSIQSTYQINLQTSSNDSFPLSISQYELYALQESDSIYHLLLICDSESKFIFDCTFQWDGCVFSGFCKSELNFSFFLKKKKHS